MSLAVVFGGQGSQRPGMADRWAGDPHAAAVIEEAARILGYDVAARWRDAEGLADPAEAQRAVFVCAVAAYRAVCAVLVEPPVAVAGHSLGEYAALVAAGALDFAPALEAVDVRAEAMASAGLHHPGGMLAVIGPSAGPVAEQIASGAETLVVANRNSPTQVVLSGRDDELREALRLVQVRGLKAIRLRVAGAFHSPLMTSAARTLDPVLAGLTFTRPGPSVVPNVDGVPARDPDRLRAALRDHLLAPVQWEATSLALAGLGVDTVVECSAAKVLLPLVQSVHPTARTHFVRAAQDVLVPAALTN